MKNNQIPEGVDLNEILEGKLKELKILKSKNDKIRDIFNEFNLERKYSETEIKILEIQIFGIDHYEDFKYEESLEKDINAVGISLYKGNKEIKKKITEKNGDNFIDKDLVLASIKISEVVGSYTNIKSEKRNIKCPFHTDKSPSMKLYSQTNSFHCFSCGRSGNAIGFIQQIEGMSFYEALKFLQNNYQ